jgi:hypothetical protein
VEALSKPSGFLASPNYPAMYPASKDCRTTITANPGQRLQFQVIDIYLAYYADKETRRCIDTLSIVDNATDGRTAYLCSGQHRDFIYTSTGHSAVVHFHSAQHSFPNAKGFWLYYEGKKQPWK